MNKKNITIIATGGTIAGRGSVGKSANYQAGTFDVEEIVQSIPQIRDLANLNTIQLCNVDSNDMGLDKWVELRNICHELEKNRYVDGIVITHGTDTLEETAFFLNLTLACHKPVVLTGSMRPATATSADGPEFISSRSFGMSYGSLASWCFSCLFQIRSIQEETYKRQIVIKQMHLKWGNLVR